MAGEFAVARIGQIAMTVQDMDRAVDFYAGVLRLPLLLRTPALALLDCAGVRLMLSLPEGEYTSNSSILYFDVPDLDAGWAALRARGVAFLGDPHKVADWRGKQLWMAFFRDSEGNTMALMSERTLRPAA